jgi:hypothetical protein
MIFSSIVEEETIKVKKKRKISKHKVRYRYLFYYMSRLVSNAISTPIGVDIALEILIVTYNQLSIDL